MFAGYDVFNYGHSYNLDSENIPPYILNGELSELKEQDECYFCIEGSLGNYILWMNGDNDVQSNGVSINPTISKSNLLKNAVSNGLTKSGCTMDCVNAKEAPSSSNGSGSNGSGSNGSGSNGGEEDFMFGMSKMTVGLVGAGALVGIYLLIS